MLITKFLIFILKTGHDDYDVVTTDDSTNSDCSCASNVIPWHDFDSEDLHDTFTSVNKEHLVLNDTLSHKNGISFNNSVSNDDDQSFLHEYG